MRPLPAPTTRRLWIVGAVFVLAVVSATVVMIVWQRTGDPGPTAPVVNGVPVFWWSEPFREPLLDRSPRADYFFPDVMAGGCGLSDLDSDGDLDALVLGEGWRAGIKVNCRVMRQEADRFVLVPQDSGLRDLGVAMGLAIGDVNNDGSPDVLVTAYGPDKLFLNRGDATFVDVTDQAGFGDDRWGASACLFDFDRDGWLDLYVANYVEYSESTKCVDPRGQADYCNPKNLKPQRHRLYRNESFDVPHADTAGPRPVRFRDVSDESGIASKAGPGLGVAAADFTGDGWLDLFVANDGAANFLWVNQQDGTFRDEAVERGCAFDLQGRPQANMGIALGDVDGNGWLDVAVTHLDGESHSLYMGRGDGFDERSGPAGIARPSFPFTGFGAVFLDWDHDGNLDLAVADGRVRRAEGAAGGSDFWAPYAETNQLFRNVGQSRFEDVSGPHEPFTARPNLGRGLAAGDIDNDGDLDVLLTTADAQAWLYLNNAPKAGHWLMVRAVDPERGGRDAYGAVVTIVAGSHRRSQAVAPCSSYLVTHDPRVHFGLGAVTWIDAIEIAWPEGTREVFPGGGVDRHVTIHRGGGR